MGRLAGLAAALAVAVLVAASPAMAQSPAEGASGPRVVIGQHAYAPAELTVAPGTTVTWVNEDEEPHTVTSATQAFASPGLDTGESFRQTFTAPGTYEYFCKLHPLMKATVIVK